MTPGLSSPKPAWTARRAIVDALITAANRDPLRLPDLQEWVAAFGGYAQIPPEAWKACDELYEEHRRRRSEYAR
jgi:hypothetical protein